MFLTNSWLRFVATFGLTSCKCGVFPLMFFIAMVAVVVAAVTPWNNVTLLRNELDVE